VKIAMANQHTDELLGECESKMTSKDSLQKMMGRTIQKRTRKSRRKLAGRKQRLNEAVKKLRKELLVAKDVELTNKSNRGLSEKSCKRYAVLATAVELYV